MKLARVHPFDIEELACYIAGLDYDEIDADSSIIEEKLEKDFGCNLDQFTHLIQRLLPMIDISSSSSPITGKKFKGFSDTENSVWFVKMEIDK